MPAPKLTSDRLLPVAAVVAVVVLVGLPAGGALGAAPAVRALAVMPPDTALRSLR